MAIHEQPRENLMRDATAYAHRLLFADRSGAREVFAGKREGSGWSLYFNEDPVIQFKADGGVRRVHFQGRNYAAVNSRLCLLDRGQRGGQVNLQSIYSEKVELELRKACLEHVLQLMNEFEQQQLQVVDRFPKDGLQMEFELINFLRDAVGDGIRIADSANV